MKEEWKKIGHNLVMETRLPGVFKRKDGGFLVRGRVLDPMTGKNKEIKRVLDVKSEHQALTYLEEEKQRIKEGLGSHLTQKPHFGDYAVSLMERKMKTKELRSPTAVARWSHTLKHLIGGSKSKDESYTVTGFGELALDDIRIGHLERWRADVAELINRGDYSPRTVNGWISILRIILKQAQREFELPRRLNEEVRDFDTYDHPTYTYEEPQSLTPEQVVEFLALTKAHFPQHYAMAFLGFCTGLRPSTLRPIRRKGSKADIIWNEGRLLVRRSHTLGDQPLGDHQAKDAVRGAIAQGSCRGSSVARGHSTEFGSAGLRAALPILGRRIS